MSLGYKFGRQVFNGLVVNAVDANPLHAGIQVGQLRSLDNINTVEIQVINRGIPVDKGVRYLRLDVLVERSTIGHIQ